VIAAAKEQKSMIICDLCGEAKDCLQKEIDGKEYDICSECWNPVLRLNSMRTENSAIPSPDGCPIQVIPSASSAKNPKSTGDPRRYLQS
jgi:hypothetical protein